MTVARGLLRWLLLHALVSYAPGASNTLDVVYTCDLPAPTCGYIASDAFAAWRWDVVDTLSTAIARSVLSERPSDSRRLFFGADPLQRLAKINSTSSSQDGTRNERAPGGMTRRIGACVAAAAAGSAGLFALASWLCCFRRGNVRQLCARALATRRAASPEEAVLEQESRRAETVQDASDDECAPLIIERIDDGSAAGIDHDPAEPTWDSSSDGEEYSVLDKIDGASERSLWSRGSCCSFDSHDKTTASELDFTSSDGEVEADGVTVEQMYVGATDVNDTDKGVSTVGDVAAEPGGSDSERENAFALAHRLVPHTSATGHFYSYLGEPHDDAKEPSANTQPYVVLIARFESIAREWISTQFDVYKTFGVCSERAELEATLVAAYAELVVTREFIDDEHKLVQCWERANAAVNEAAFRVVRSALDGYNRAMASLSCGCTNVVRLNILEQRLENFQMLDILGACDSYELQSTLESQILGVNAGKLSLLELRALTYVFQSARGTWQRSPTTSRIEAKKAIWYARLRKALVDMKHDYDAHRRLQMKDRAGTGWCCMSAQTCAFRASWECVLPIYKAHASANLMTAYCDLEASTH